MAAHSLYLTGESLHKRFGVLYSGDRVVFSELCESDMSQESEVTLI